MNMSIDCRYLTNGEKTAFTLLHTDTGIVESYEKREDIPKEVRHYFRYMDKPKMIGPDLAMILHLSSVFYPEWPKMCNDPALNGKKMSVCWRILCSFNYPHGMENVPIHCRQERR